MRPKIKYAIGIDPGTNTGFAVWDRHEKRFVAIQTMDIISAIEELKTYLSESIFVRIEDPHQRKWYGHNSQKKIQGAGSVKRDFKIIKNFLEKNNIPYHAYNPKDVRTKLRSDVFEKITGWKKRTSNHSRDAAMSVFGF